MRKFLVKRLIPFIRKNIQAELANGTVYVHLFGETIKLIRVF